MKKFLVFIIGLSLISYYSFTLFPFGNLFEHTLKYVSIYRITFATLLITKLIRGTAALPLILGYERIKNSYFPKGIHYAKIILAIIILLGFLTEFTALLFFLLHLRVFLKSKYFSIEDIYFQNTLFHLPFIASGSFYSIDSILGIQANLGSAIFFNSFFISNGIIMLSAGYEKFKSKLWLSGKGALSFISLPHLVKPLFHFLHKQFKPLFMVTGYLIMSAEFLFLLSALEKHLFLVVLLILIGFAITLFIVVDISFIGQILVLNFGLFLAILSANWESYNLPSFVPITNYTNWTIWITILLNMLTLIIVCFYSFSNKYKLHFIQKFLTGVNSPIAVFNEKHLFGFYTYRLNYFKKAENTSQPVIEAFDSQGFPGKYQILYPRYFQGAMYPVTDYCLGVYKYGLTTQYKVTQMVDLLFCGLHSLGESEGTVALSVKKYDMDDTIGDYASRPWITIAQCSFSENAYTYKTLNLPPKLKKTFREV